MCFSFNSLGFRASHGTVVLRVSNKITGEPVLQGSDLLLPTYSRSKCVCAHVCVRRIKKKEENVPLLTDIQHPHVYGQIGCPTGIHWEMKEVEILRSFQPEWREVHFSAMCFYAIVSTCSFSGSIYRVVFFFFPYASSFAPRSTAENRCGHISGGGFLLFPSRAAAVDVWPCTQAKRSGQASTCFTAAHYIRTTFPPIFNLCRLFLWDGIFFTLFWVSVIWKMKSNYWGVWVLNRCDRG